MTNAHLAGAAGALAAAPVQRHIRKTGNIQQYITRLRIYRSQQLPGTIDKMQCGHVQPEMGNKASISPGCTCWPAASRTRPSAQAQDVSTPEP